MWPYDWDDIVEGYFTIWSVGSVDKSTCNLGSSVKPKREGYLVVTGWLSRINNIILSFSG